jgi:hypothetical protein
MIPPIAMAELNSLLTDNLALVLGVLALVVIVLLVVVTVQSVRLGRALGAYRRLVGEGAGGNLGDVLGQHMERVDGVMVRLDEVRATHETIERRTRRSLQHIGMVRFNPFEDTGSDQSFAIALLDDSRDGVVISSLHGRANTRVFAKPVEGGASSHHLSDEEAQAIRIAVSGTGSDVS